MLSVILSQWRERRMGVFLRVDNFAAVSGRKACDMSKVSEFRLEKCIKLACQ